MHAIQHAQLRGGGAHAAHQRRLIVVAQRVPMRRNRNRGDGQQQADQRGELNIAVGVGEGATQGLGAVARAYQALRAVELRFERGAECGDCRGVSGKLVQIFETTAGLENTRGGDVVGMHEHAWREAEYAAQLTRFFDHHACDAQSGFANPHRVADLRAQQRQQGLIDIDRSDRRLGRAGQPGAEGAGGDAHRVFQRIGGVHRAQRGELKGILVGDHAGEFQRATAAQRVGGKSRYRTRTGDEQIRAEKVCALLAQRARQPVAEKAGGADAADPDHQRQQQYAPLAMGALAP